MRSEVKGKRALVIGLARSGVAAATLLAESGAQVTGSDVKKTPELSRYGGELHELDVSIRLGPQTSDLLDGMELVVVSPGVPPKAPILREARRREMEVVDEVEIASWFARAPLVAVTGSNGKSTTSAWLGDVFRRAGLKVAVAGNIGCPLSRVASEIPEDGIIIVEVSSFQLERTKTFHPQVSVLLNITPDHLDRHGSFSAYREAKKRIFLNQTKSDHGVLNADDPEVYELASLIKGQVIPFSVRRELDVGSFIRDDHLVFRWKGDEVKVIHLSNISLPGPHNLSNALATVAAILPFQLPRKAIQKSLREFAGLRHRLETIETVQGVRFINDSKATNVESLRYALLSLAEPIVLIAGGRDKGADFASLGTLIKERVKAAVLIGEAAVKMIKAWGETIPCRRAENMVEAVIAARTIAAPGDSVLLAPGCASFDMFRDFEDRGDQFREAVAKIKENHG